MGQFPLLLRRPHRRRQGASDRRLIGFVVLIDWANLMGMMSGIDADEGMMVLIVRMGLAC